MQMYMQTGVRADAGVNVNAPANVAAPLDIKRSSHTMLCRCKMKMNLWLNVMHVPMLLYGVRCDVKSKCGCNRVQM